MASYDYRVLVGRGVVWEHRRGGFDSGLTAAEAVDFARRELTAAGFGTARIERCKVGTVGRSGLYHPWREWREYRCGADGIVRRTDR